MAKKSAAVKAADTEPPPTPTLGLDETENLDQPSRGRQGDEGRPFCPVHLCLMTAAGSLEKVTKYACPVPHCQHTQKRARPQLRIPAQPRRCPDRVCAGNPTSFLQVDNRRPTNGLSLTLRCPNCSYTQPEPNPGASAFYSRQRADQERDTDEKIGER